MRTATENSWNCCGCGDSSNVPDSLLFIRPDANNHAAVCRAIPLK